MAIAIEDNFEDVVSKAARGLGVGTSQLCEAAGVDRQQFKDFLAGSFDESIARALAPLLGLDAESLVALGRQAWYPASVEVHGLAMFTSAYHDMLVNAYVVWDDHTREAALFDTGTDAGSILAMLKDNRLNVSAIYLTHTHVDHVAKLDELSLELNCPVYVGEGEPGEFGRTFKPGEVFHVGGLKVDTRLTRGHSAGGISYIVSGLSRPVAIVGDALFAGSMGGGMVSYADALETNRKSLFALEDDTVICPGHGPMSSIGEERLHNPFFA